MFKRNLHDYVWGCWQQVSQLDRGLLHNTSEDCIDQPAGEQGTGVFCAGYPWRDDDLGSGTLRGYFPFGRGPWAGSACLHYCIESGENDAGIVCFGAAVLDDAQRPIAAVSVSIPAFRMESDERVYAGQLVQCCERISALKGWPGRV